MTTITEDRPKVFGAGLPTKSACDDLDRAFESRLMPKQMITYDEIERVIGVKRGTFRFSSILTQWRKRLDRENNIVLRAEPGIGYEVMDSHDRVTFSGQKLKSGIKHIARGADVASRTSEAGLTDEEVRTRDHLVCIGAKIKLTANTESKRLKMFDD